MQTPALKRSLILYVDELGTKEKLKTMGTSELQEQLRNQRELDEFLVGNNITGLSPSRRFSDNVIVGVDLGPEPEVEIMNLTLSAAFYQSNLALRKCFIRGALLEGDLYIDSDCVTGYGLVAADEMEKTKAIYPRILLDEDLHLYLEREASSYYAPEESSAALWVARSGDGGLFVNYLTAISADDDLSAEEKWQLYKQHKDNIEAELRKNSGSDRVLEKFEWCARYHNWYCGRFQDPHLLISDDLLTMNKAEWVFQPIF